MKKTAVISLILCLIAAAAAGCSKPGGLPAGETLSIGDISVRYREAAAVQTNLSAAEAAKIDYLYNGNGISIRDGVVRGLKPNTSTEVTAVYGKSTAKFTVTVEYDSIGKPGQTGDGVFELGDNGDFVKSEPEQAEAYFYKGGELFGGERYIFSGTLEMSGCKEDAQAEIVLRNSETGYVKFALRYHNASSYTLFSESRNGEGEPSRNVLKTVEAGGINFLIMWKDGAAYFYLDNAFVSKTPTELAETSLAFGGRDSAVTLSRLHGSKNDELIDKLIAEIARPFGAHTYGDAEIHTNIFYETAPGSYLKKSYHYAQTFFYADGKPLAGTTYAVSGRIEMLRPDVYGQVALMICKSDADMIRVIFEKLPGSGYHVFTDQKAGGAFSNYRVLTSAAASIDFEIVYYRGAAYVYIDDNYVGKSEYALGNTHFGIGGDRCQFVVSNLSGTFDVDPGRLPEGAAQA